MSERVTLQVRPLETEVDLYLEVFAGGSTRAYALDYPGFFLDGPSEERVLREAPTALWKFGHWLRNHGDRAPFRGALPRVRVAERVRLPMVDGAGRATAIFSPERRAPAPQLVALFRKRLGWAEEEMVGLVRGLPENLLNRSGPAAPALVEILTRLAETERGWLNRLLLKVRVEGPEASGPLEGLLATRRAALEALERFPAEAWGQLFVTTLEGPDGPFREEWSLAKLLRCMLTNQREQTAALRRSL